MKAFLASIYLPQSHHIFGQGKVLGSISGASTEIAQFIAAKLSAESKVCNFDVHLSIIEHVLWLQVPVDDAPLVADLHSV